MNEIHKIQKTPSFPFYPKDWLSDINVQSLSHEEKGIYLDMLCYSWLDDLPDDAKVIAKILRCDSSAIIQSIIDRFFTVKKGKIFNKKIEKIKQELIEFRKKKSEAGKLGNAKRWGKKKVSQCDDFATRKQHRKTSPPTPSSIPTPINKEKNIIKKENTPKQKSEKFFKDVELQTQEYFTLIDHLGNKGIPENIAMEEIAKFVSYWTELNSTGRKQKWEMQKTFEINRRLANWFSNYKNFNGGNEGGGMAFI
jgi:uncharacterized protein YdaU (DUF1376 family)